MHENNILNNLTNIARQPFLIFANQVDEKTDNALETLQLLAKEEEVTAGRISEYLDIKPSSVTQIIKKLEEAGTAEKVKSQKDARVTYVKLTAKGRESLEYRGNISVNLRDELFKDFTEEELTKLDNYLARMATNVSSEEFQEKLNKIFGDDQRWQQFEKMSAHFGRARGQMLDRSGFNDF
ncbi:DNA-binding MarR family transcriptional regulator [Enterococcus sp. PF1-24]|uniref:MarR family winged helix-turn-helix transcriptional regulator n=1 Tax=unclassified Enterococcus TaxID=2608891 RepID=UPI0024730C6F|nr:MULTISPECIES: MarR family transcriptional regulator [unclassified Enterococcus]MDH6363900.1 DNA-binding MarR family transcriptional regulator [Enterococcus sp. PFB1-1]MDH6400914.1 DNA-binding MarR family transcriptional regulator [Enterococcus sp. PF1-24]